MKKLYILSLIILMFSGCAHVMNSDVVDREQQDILDSSKNKLLLLKTPQYTFYDFATIKNIDGTLNIDIYKLGIGIANIKISSFQICINNECSLKWIVSKQLLGDASYSTLLEEIFKARDIFKGKNLVKTNDAIIQDIMTNGQHIYYERKKGRVMFENKTSKIQIMIEDYN